MTACLYISGGHILSGACVETRALDELFPDWKDRGVCKILQQYTVYFVFLFECIQGTRISVATKCSYQLPCG